MPTARGSVAAAAVAGCLYVFNGELNPNRPSGVYDENEVYDPRADTWQALTPVPVPVLVPGPRLGRWHIGSVRTGPTAHRPDAGPGPHRPNAGLRPAST